MHIDRLSPRARRLIAAVVAVGGVVLVGQVLGSDAPREVTVRAELRDWAGHRVERVRVRFLREGESLREVVLVPREGGQSVETVMHLPATTLGTEVEVTSEGRVFARGASVRVRAGEVVAVEVPQP